MLACVHQLGNHRNIRDSIYRIYPIWYRIYWAEWFSLQSPEHSGQVVFTPLVIVFTLGWGLEADMVITSCYSVV